MKIQCARTCWFQTIIGVGKTTVIKQVIQKLKENNEEVSGFFTEEVRHAGDRIGFDIVTVSGQRGVLSRTKSVSITIWETLILPTLS